MFRTALMTLAACSALQLGVQAQTQLVRGDIDGIKNTRLFQLDCTHIRLVSTTVNLQKLHDASRQNNIEYEMQVRDVSSGGTKMLNVISAKAITEMMNMGNLRFGRSDTWEVFGPSGSLAVVFLQSRSMTSYLPLGSAGTWLLGGNAILFNFGTITNGSFRFNFQPPTIQSLVGQEFSSQALIVSRNGGLTITNPDCKEVRSK